jgi:hypothetical protein
MYDFSYYISPDTKYLSDQNLDVFRHQPPKHVRKVAFCFKKMYVTPTKWKSIAFKYGLSCNRIKLIGNFRKINEQQLKSRVLKAPYYGKL